jgi:transcription antitermination factor NusG
MEWAVVTTAPNTERIVSDALRHRHNMPHHMFKRPVMKAWRGRVIERLVPAFPRYIFIPEPFVWRTLYLVPQITSILASPNGIPWLVRHEEIESLRLRCIDDDTFPAIKVPDPFKRGDIIIVTGHHPFNGHRGEYQNMLTDQTALFLFDWLGRKVPISVDVSDVELPTSPVEVAPKRWRNRRRGGRMRKKRS